MSTNTREPEKQTDAASVVGQQRVVSGDCTGFSNGKWAVTYEANEMADFRQKLLESGVKSLKEFGYPKVDAENILTIFWKEIRRLSAKTC